MSSKYPITYNIKRHDPPLEKDEVIEKELGGCDSIIIISQIYPEDGSYSQAIVSLDGRTNDDVGLDELWKAWTIMAASLAKEEALSPSKRSLCNQVIEIVRESILKTRNGI